MQCCRLMHAPSVMTLARLWLTFHWRVQCKGQLSWSAGALAAGVHCCGCCYHADPKEATSTAPMPQRWRPLQLPAWPMQDCQLPAHLLSQHVPCNFRPWYPRHLASSPQPLWRDRGAGWCILLSESFGYRGSPQARPRAGPGTGRAGSSHPFDPDRRTKVRAEVHGYGLLGAAGLMAGSATAPALAPSAPERPRHVGA
jgi:hypothetical protein